MSDMNKQATKQAARTIQQLTDLTYQQARTVVVDKRVDLIPDADVPMDDTSYLGAMTWGEVVLGIADDERVDLIPAHPYCVKTILRCAGYEVAWSGPAELTFTYGNIAGTVSAGDWSFLTLANGPAKTGLDMNCPSPGRVAAAIEQVLLDTSDAPVEAGPVVARLNGPRGFGDEVDVYATATFEVSASYTTDRTYEAAFDLEERTVRIHEQGATEQLSKSPLVVEGNTPTAFAHAIHEFVTNETAAPEPAAPTVWLLSITHKYGTETTAHTTEQAAQRALRGYIADNWHEVETRNSDGSLWVTEADADGDEDIRLMSPEEAEQAGHDIIDIYFDTMEDVEGYELSPQPVLS